MDERTSPCDVCGAPVPVPEQQSVGGWIGGHRFGMDRSGMMVLQDVRCRHHLHWTDPEYLKRKGVTDSDTPKKK